MMSEQQLDWITAGQVIDLSDTDPVQLLLAHYFHLLSCIT